MGLTDIANGSGAQSNAGAVLLMDRVNELIPGHSGKGIKNIAAGDPLLHAEKERLPVSLVAFERQSDDSRSGLAALHDGTDEIGYVANFEFSPSRERTIGLASLDARYGWPGLDFEVETATGPVPVRTVSAPFLNAQSNLWCRPLD